MELIQKAHCNLHHAGVYNTYFVYSFILKLNLGARKTYDCL